MDVCAHRIIGGLIEIIAGDATFHAMGDVSIMPTTVERDASATTSGKAVVTERAVPAEFSCDFANIAGEADPMILWSARCNINVTVVEKSRGIRHLFTNVTVVGRPDINLSTGTFAGLRGVTDEYTRAE